jgi:hypothetical protein
MYERSQVAQMSLAEHHDMIKTFAPDRTDQPFSMSILPWRSRRRWPVTLHISDNSPLGDLAIEAVVGRERKRAPPPGQAAEISPSA